MIAIRSTYKYDGTIDIKMKDNKQLPLCFHHIKYNDNSLAAVLYLIDIDYTKQLWHRR